MEMPFYTFLYKLYREQTDLIRLIVQLRNQVQTLTKSEANLLSKLAISIENAEAAKREQAKVSTIVYCCLNFRLKLLEIEH